jgi:DNA-binding transcriptional ArsR family regulator
MELSDRQVHHIAKALADPRRYQILRQIGGKKDATLCSDMLKCVKISAATLSHHMKELETAGLVVSEKEGKFVRYIRQGRVLRAYLSRLKSDLG